MPSKKASSNFSGSKAGKQSIENSQSEAKRVRAGMKLRQWLEANNLLGSGPLSHELRRLDLKRRHRGSEAHEFLAALERNGIDSDGVLGVLHGRNDPHIDVFDLHCEWALAAQYYYQHLERRKLHMTLSREYRNLRRLDEQIIKSHLFSDSLKKTFKDELRTIPLALSMLIVEP